MEGLPEGVERESLEEFINTVKVDDGSGNMVTASQDQIIEMMNNPENTLVPDYEAWLQAQNFVHPGGDVVVDPSIPTAKGG